MIGEKRNTGKERGKSFGEPIKRLDVGRVTDALEATRD